MAWRRAPDVAHLLSRWVTFSAGRVGSGILADLNLIFRRFVLLMCSLLFRCCHICFFDLFFWLSMSLRVFVFVVHSCFSIVSFATFQLKHLSGVPSSSFFWWCCLPPRLWVVLLFPIFPCGWTCLLPLPHLGGASFLRLL